MSGLTLNYTQKEEIGMEKGQETGPGVGERTGKETIMASKYLYRKREQTVLPGDRASEHCRKVLWGPSKEQRSNLYSLSIR